MCIIMFTLSRTLINHVLCALQMQRESEEGPADAQGQGEPEQAQALASSKAGFFSADNARAAVLREQAADRAIDAALAFFDQHKPSPACAVLGKRICVVVIISNLAQFETFAFDLASKISHHHGCFALVRSAQMPPTLPARGAHAY